MRQTALSGLFGSKRFIVSVCAAIAMVLGALSVGASVFVPSSAVEGQEYAAHSPIFTERSSSNANDTASDDDVFAPQHTLVPDTLTQPKTTDKPPAKITPKAKAGSGIQFGPVKVNSGISLGSLQIKVNTSVIAPIVDIVPEVVPPVEVPVAEPPAAEPTTEDPASPLPEEISNRADTLSVSVDATVQP